MTDLERMIQDTNSQISELDRRIRYSTEYARKKGYVHEMTIKLADLGKKLKLLEEAQRLVDLANNINL